MCNIHMYARADFSVPCLLLMLSTHLNKETSLKDAKPQILMFPSQFAIVPNVKHVGVECVKCEKCQKRKKSLAYVAVHFPMESTRRVRETNLTNLIVYLD